MDKINQFLFGNNQRPEFVRIVKWMWLAVFAGVFLGMLVFIVLSFTDLPSVEELENPRSNEASLIYADDGSIMATYYTENRIPVTFDELSPNLINALVATEDERYYEHTGIDFEALARAIVKTGLMGQSSAGGASTITQQLAKLLFTEKSASSTVERIFQKLKEWIIAVRLERKYTKEEIIAMYLNKFEYVNGAFGIKQAAKIYFDEDQDSLSMTQAATLVGMLKNPSLYDPLRWPEKVLHRRMVVLKQMEKNGFITNAEYDSLRQTELGIKFTRQTHIDGPAPYFRMELAKEVKDILAQPGRQKADGSNYNIYRDGLRIYTTINPVMQRIAEEEMRKRMPVVQKAFWETWRWHDPWKYTSGSETEIPVEIRQLMLTRLMRSSERYQSLRAQYLNGVIAKINQDVDLMFHDDDREVERIVEESKKSGTVTRLVSQNMISTDLATQYRKVLKNPNFPELKNQWESLQAEVEEVFNKPTEMTVFAYNEAMEKDTTMSPMDSIRYHRMFLQTGMVAVEPATGHVKVWVGGIDHKYFKFDHVTINRQVGSTFKPFIYATAIFQQGFSPCFQVYDLPVTITPQDRGFYLNEPWTPRNSHNSYSGELLTLKEGLRQSKNTVSAFLMKQLGSVNPVLDLVHRMGIDKNDKYSNGRYRLPRVPSIALGAADMSVLELTGAYTTFANNGIFNKPTFISRIEDKNGRILYETFATEQQALPPNSNYIMVEMLRHSGTLQGYLKSDVGGKTGTTNDYADGWFVGITPNLVVGAWTGGEDRWVSFRNITYGQGAFMSKPLVRNFLKRLEEEPASGYNFEDRFYRPPGDLGIELDCDKYGGDLPPLEGGDEFEDEFSEDQFGEDQFGPVDTIRIQQQF